MVDQDGNKPIAIRSGNLWISGTGKLLESQSLRPCECLPGLLENRSEPFRIPQQEIYAHAKGRQDNQDK